MMFERRNRSSAVFGLILVALGLMFLVGQFVPVQLSHYLWPFTVIAFGGLFFIGMLAGGRSSGALAIPGSIITTVGLILLFQNTFGHWEAWSYGWTLILTSVGVGLVIQGYWSGIEEVRVRGWRVVRLGVLFFLLFGAFFELVIGFGRGDQASQLLWPLGLIGVGIYLMVTRLLPGKRSQSIPPSTDDQSSPYQGS